MSTKNFSNKELIKQVSTKVDDPNLRKQLIEELIERDATSSSIRKSQSYMAVHPEAIPGNVCLKKWVNAIGGIVFFLLVYSHYRDTPESAASHSFLWLMTFIMPLVFLLKHIHLSNISKWQRRGRNSTR